MEMEIIPIIIQIIIQTVKMKPYQLVWYRVQTNTALVLLRKKKEKKNNCTYGQQDQQIFMKKKKKKKT